MDWKTLENYDLMIFFLYDRQRKIFHATGNVPKTAIRKIRDHGISVDETIFQINVPKEEIKT